MAAYPVRHDDSSKNRRPQPWRPSGGMMLAVEDVAEATRRVGESGGKVLSGSTTLSLHRRKDGSVG